MIHRSMSLNQYTGHPPQPSRRREGVQAMAVLRFPRTDQRFADEAAIRSELATLGIDYERWNLDRVAADASAVDVLLAYASEIEEMMRRGGYVTADVSDVNPA